MPKLAVMVPETLNMITRPVVLTVAREIMKDTGIHSKTPIFFPGDTEQAAQPNSLITPADDVSIFPFSDRLMITVDENYEQDRILSMAVYQPENRFIFRDDRIETCIKPAYSSADITINFSYRAVDKTQAMRFRDDMRTRIGMMRDERLHLVSYGYMIPPEYLVILQELHRMREAVAGYGEDWDTYFKANVTQRASILTNLAGNQPAWGISESQMRVVGYWDFEGAPEQGSKEDDLDTWTVTFGYKFRFDKPVACVMEYPLMIHNQLVEKYRPSEEDQVDSPEYHQRSYSLSSESFSFFEKGREHTGRKEGVDIPSFDDFIPASVPKPTLRVLTALTSIDEDNPSLLMNFHELGDEDELHPVILAFMAKEAMYMTKPFQSIFQLNLYRNINLMPWTALTVNNALDVTTPLELSLRDYHHVRLSVVTDLRLLNPKALDRLRENGAALQILIKYIAPWISKVPPILSGDYVSKADLDKAIDEINGELINKGNRQDGYQMNTVETLFIQAFRRE
jgi:hypothetical protein